MTTPTPPTGKDGAALTGSAMSTCDGSSLLSRHTAVRSEICSGTGAGGSSPAACEQTPAAAPPTAAAATTTAPTADDSSTFPGSDKPERGASDTRIAEDIRRARARTELVKKNLKASWGSHATRRKSPYWGFFVDNYFQEADDCEVPKLFFKYELTYKGNPQPLLEDGPAAASGEETEARRFKARRAFGG
eukprot:jgi/Tetstr1/423292/TSEL_013991.t1